MKIIKGLKNEKKREEENYEEKIGNLENKIQKLNSLVESFPSETDYEKNYLDSDEELNKLIEETSNENNCNIIKGNIFTSDVFYEKKDYKQKVIDYEVLGVEMETFGLLQTAKISNKKATSILTVVNSFSYTEELTSEEREKKLDKMITLALKTSLKI